MPRRLLPGLAGGTAKSYPTPETRYRRIVKRAMKAGGGWPAVAATTPLDALQQRVDKLTGSSKKCQAVIVEHAEEPGKVFALLMACPGNSGCARCRDARARLWKPPVAAATVVRRARRAERVIVSPLGDEFLLSGASPAA